MMSWGSLKDLPWSKTLDIFTLKLNFLEWYDKKSLSGFYPISKRKHCMTLHFLNLDTLHQRLRIHSYVTGCTTERVWGGGGGLLIIVFSSWPRLLVLNMCIVQLGPSTGSWPADASNWRPRISIVSLKLSLKRPDLYFVIHRNNTTEKVFVCTIFIFPVHDTILCPSRAKDTRFRPIPQIFLPPKNPGIENFKPHNILQIPPVTWNL